MIICLGCRAPLGNDFAARADVERPNLIGCWNLVVTAQQNQRLAPGSMYEVQLCFARNGVTSVEAFAGGGWFDGVQAMIEGWGGSGTYYFSNGRLILNGALDFDTFTRLSCLPAIEAQVELVLADCIERVDDDYSRVGPRRYVRAP